MKMIYLRKTAFENRHEDRKSGKINFNILSVYVEELGFERFNFYLHEDISVSMIGVQDITFSMHRDLGYELLNVTKNTLYKEIVPFADQFKFQEISLRYFKRLRNLFLELVEPRLRKSNIRPTGQTVKFGTASSENQFFKCDSKYEARQTLFIANLNVLFPTPERVARYEGGPPTIDLAESIYLLITNKKQKSPVFNFRLSLGDRGYMTFEEAQKKIARGAGEITLIDKKEYQKLRDFCIKAFRKEKYRIIPEEEYNIN